MSFLWPRVGKKNENATDTCVAQSINDVARIALIDSHIVELLRDESGQQLCHAGYIGLNTDQSNVRIGCSLRDEMFAGAEPYFKPNLARGGWCKTGFRIGCRLWCQ